MTWRIIDSDQVPDPSPDDDWEEIESELLGLPTGRAIEVTVGGSSQSIVARVSAFGIKHDMAGAFGTRRRGDRVFIYRRV